MANVMPANQRSARRTGIPLRVVSIGAAVSAHRPAPSLVPYGAWSSPLSAEAQSAGRVGIADLRSVDGRLYWTQTEPAAGGISALYTFRGGAPYNSRGDAAAALSPAGINVRTRVHEYGGAPTSSLARPLITANSPISVCMPRDPGAPRCR